ncbi:hypothetical protein F4820DRAFT_261424 [Hypoxylon rubiginosum]|uniref:Uncharacterized protein n=1 Tax=Hypoxylon rubiginosum TaxID=110542 RepID=A0ACB9Z5S1_9PEZI|nr:hypothetical protein F4820DRAFT_261424 [Hypoxylon rubiginosum]
MESLIPRSGSLGILVEKEIMVQTVDNANANANPERDPVPSHRPSVVSVVQSVSDLRRNTRASEPEEEKIPPVPPAKMVPRPGFHHEERLETLADFFRSPPPPSNFMSLPDNLSAASADGKWSILKAFRKKRKSQRTRPPLIILPDSAISARTSSGRRYIAISIPSEQSHTRPVLPTQFPVTESMEAEFHRAVDARLEPIRSMTFDRGKRILNPSAVDRESLSSVSLAPRSSTRPEEITSLAPPPKKVSMLSIVPSEETPPKKGKEPDKRRPIESMTPHITPLSALGSVGRPYATERRSTSPKRERRSQIDRQKTSELKGPDIERVLRVVDVPPTKRDRRGSQEKQRARTGDEPPGGSSVPKSNTRNPSKSPGHLSRTLSANRPSSLALPVRTSSINAGTPMTESSEAGNTATIRPAPISRAVSSNNEGSGNDDRKGSAGGPRGSFAESLVTTESSPKLCKAETAMAFQSVPIVVRPPSRQEIDSPLNLNFPSPPSSRVSRSTQRDFLSPPSAPERSTSRKDRVRERKQRDIEKLKAQIRQIQSPATHLRPGVADSLWPESPVLGRFSEKLTSPSPSRPLPTSKRSDAGPIRPGKNLKSPYLSPEDVFKKRRGRSSSVPILTSSSSRSSLESPSMPWEGSTSYFRRKERQAEREENEARRVRHVAHALVEEKENQERLSRQKLIRRYERLKESRTKDMEKRLHRLERNGEVLMQSLVSMMETLNKLLQGQQTLQQSISVYPELLQSYGRRQSMVLERSQSLRSIRSDDRSFETLRLRLPHKKRRSSLRIAAREGSIRGGELGPKEGGDASATIAPQTVLESLQEQLRDVQSRQGAHARGDSSLTSSTSHSTLSDGADDLGIDEPLLRELQEATADREAEEGRTPLGESEVFNLF